MDKTYKQDDSKKILAMIRKAIAQHRADIADKLNVDSPAVARNDRHGNPIIDKPNQQGGAHKRHTSVRQQFQKLHNEAAEDDKTDSGVGSDDPKASKGREKIDSKEKELDTKPVAKSGKTGDIVMYPDEKEYGNAEGAQKVMDTRAEQTIVKMYEAYLGRIAGEFHTANDNPNPRPDEPTAEQKAHVKHFHENKIKSKNGSTVTAQDAYEAYKAHCEEHKKEPLALPTFGREFQKLKVKKTKVGRRVRFHNIELNQ